MLEPHYSDTRAEVAGFFTRRPAEHIITYGLTRWYGFAKFGSWGTVFFTQSSGAFANRAFDKDHNGIIEEVTEPWGEKSEYVMGHIIHSEMGGNTDFQNLVPLARGANKAHSKYERAVLDIASKLRYYKDEVGVPLYLGYNVEVTPLVGRPEGIILTSCLYVERVEIDFHGLVEFHGIDDRIRARNYNDFPFYRIIKNKDYLPWT